MQIYLTLVRDTFDKLYDSSNTPLNHRSQKTCSVIWLQSGSLTINGEALAVGDGAGLGESDRINTTEPTVALRFIVSSNVLNKPSNKDKAYTCDIIDSQKINAPSNTILFRLDQVDFPPGAIAYRHTHPGPGTRYLVDGGLTLESDHDDLIINPMDAWFEDANSPVKATAISTKPSRFIRAMLLPLEFEGKSTFTLQDPTDANLPRLQTNVRHYEKQIRLSELL